MVTDFISTSLPIPRTARAPGGSPSCFCLPEPSFGAPSSSTAGFDCTDNSTILNSRNLPTKRALGSFFMNLFRLRDTEVVCYLSQIVFTAAVGLAKRGVGIKCSKTNSEMKHPINIFLHTIFLLLFFFQEKQTNPNSKQSITLDMEFFLQINPPDKPSFMLQPSS